jgi:hypothetical protein
MCVCVCVCVCIHTHIHTCVHMYMSLYVYISTCVYTCISILSCKKELEQTLVAKVSCFIAPSIISKKKKKVENTNLSKLQKYTTYTDFSLCFIS